MTLKVIIVTFILACSFSVSAQLQFDTDKTTELKTSKAETPKLSIYPNPTSDFFALKYDDTVANIIVYNWIGKKLESFTHKAGRVYNVKDLDKGIYIVRMFDDQNKLVKVLRLHRN